MLKFISVFLTIAIASIAWGGSITSSYTVQAFSGTSKTTASGGSYSQSTGLGQRALTTPTTVRVESYITGSNSQTSFNERSKQSFGGQSITFGGNSVGYTLGYEASTSKARRYTNGGSSSYEAGVYTESEQVGGNTSYEAGGYIDVAYDSFNSVTKTNVDAYTGYTISYSN